MTLIDWSRIEQAKDWTGVWGLFHPGDAAFDYDFFPLYRRFLCACCRELTPWLVEESRDVLEVIERFAYGKATFAEFVAARNYAKLAARKVRKQHGKHSRLYAASVAVRDSARNHGFEALLLACKAFPRAGLSCRRQGLIFERVAAEWVAEEHTLVQVDQATH